MVAAVFASNLVVLLAIVQLLLLLPAWREPGWNLWRSLNYTLFLLVLLMLSMALNEWNMLGFKY